VVTEQPDPTRYGRTSFSDRLTGRLRSPVVRRRGDEMRAPRKAVIAARAWQGGD
jgi:hypothetical protein